MGQGWLRRQALYHSGAARDGGLAAFADVYETYTLKGRGPVIVTGRAVGEKIASGRTRRIATARDLAAFKPGEILVAPATSPDWEPVMKIAAGVITDKGGRTCHAAIVARELGIPAVVGATHATEKLKTGTNVTISCAEGDIGSVYQGTVAFDVTRTPVSELRQPRTAIMVNVGTPEMAFRVAMQPQAGVGLARMEFIISEHIGIHPMALLKPEKIASAKARAAIARWLEVTKARRISSSRGCRKASAPLPRRSIPSRSLCGCPTSRPTNMPACSAARRSSPRKRIRCSDSGGPRVTATRLMRKGSRWSVRRCAGCARRWAFPICASWCRSAGPSRKGDA